MRYRQLGTSGLEVSVLAHGAWQLGDAKYWGEDSSVDEQAAVDAALEAGINLFDTAEGYGGGASEKTLGTLLGTRRKDVYIASKVSPANCAPGDLRKSCEASLERLGTDVLDLYQVHWPVRDVPMAEAYAELERLQEQGKIRFIGLSNYGPHDLAEWFAGGTAVSNQLGYNLLFRAIEYQIVPECQRLGLGILVYMPVLQGILTDRWETIEDIPEARRRTRHFSDERSAVRHGEPGCERLTMETLARIREVCRELGKPMAQVAIAWLLAKPGVTSVIIGGRKRHQLERNIEAASLELGPETVARLDEITLPLKEYFGASWDMWQSGESSRIR